LTKRLACAYLPVYSPRSLLDSTESTEPVPHPHRVAALPLGGEIRNGTIQLLGDSR
jgi:hypothetical protein